MNIFLLKDMDSREGRVDLVILTNEEQETIERTIQETKEKWYEKEYPASLLEEIMEALDKMPCVTYYYHIQEIYY